MMEKGKDTRELLTSLLGKEDADKFFAQVRELVRTIKSAAELEEAVTKQLCDYMKKDVTRIVVSEEEV